MFLYVIFNFLLISFVHCHSQYPILIIVSYDAFRYNYFLKNHTPFLSQLKSQGTTADFLTNVFPTKTFPNHHSISTGLYPEIHGVVDNSFYEPNLNRIVEMSPEMYQYSDNILPIWTLNEKSGNGRHSGVMMWPGSNYPFGGIQPTYIYKWNSSTSWYHRVDTIITWITNKSKPANLIMLYIEEPDFHGHAFGMDSSVVSDLLKQLDNVTCYLHDQLREHRLIDQVNVIHLSDHGMSSVGLAQILNITQYLQPDSYITAGSSPTLHFIPKKGFEQDVYQRLKSVSTTNKHFKVYRKTELLSRWHFKNNRRVPPIFTVADPGYAFQDLFKYIELYKKIFNFTVNSKSVFGVHGYDNEDPDMRPFFIAKGPGVKVAHKVPPFSTLDLYNLFCALLDLKPDENNGTFANVRDILAPRNDNSKFLYQVGAAFILVTIVGCMLGGYVLYNVRGCSRRDYPSARYENILKEMEGRNIIETQHLLEPEDI